MKTIKLLLVAPMYHNGDESQGQSYEYYNFFQTLRKMRGVDLAAFDYLEVMKKQARAPMNQTLLETVKRGKFNLVLVIPFTDQLIPEIVDEINKYSPTVGYFYDDMWRIEYARFWAAHFQFITTSDCNGVRKFQAAGHSNVIFSPFACNHRAYYKTNFSKEYDVSFVGQYHPLRAWYIKKIRRAGINVDVWGHGWKRGPLSQQEMVEVFNRTKINLNLSNSVSWDLRYFLSSFRAAKNTLGSVIKSDRKTYEQVKGRHFEINACGSFQLSYYVEGLERCYTIGEEIGLYASPDEAVEKIRYYLKCDDERETIAQRGHERTLADHTMEKRIAALFSAVGLQPKVEDS